MGQGRLSFEYEQRAETRDAFIDVLLKEAGWPLEHPRDREFPVQGMPNNTGEGFVDYVLWGEDGRPLALVEAKRTRRSATEGEQQARLYADCLEKAFGRRPLIFLSNGYQHWLWDDVRSAKREVQGFYTRDQLELAIQRRTTKMPLATTPINEAIVERYYQSRAIRRVSESFEKDKLRNALLVMATGSGKTRTIIALAEVPLSRRWRDAHALGDRSPRQLVLEVQPQELSQLPHGQPLCRHWTFLRKAASAVCPAPSTAVAHPLRVIGMRGTRTSGAGGVG